MAPLSRYRGDKGGRRGTFPLVHHPFPFVTPSGLLINPKRLHTTPTQNLNALRDLTIHLPAIPSILSSSWNENLPAYKIKCSQSRPLEGGNGRSFMHSTTCSSFHRHSKTLTVPLIILIIYKHSHTGNPASRLPSPRTWSSYAALPTLIH
jgi:hypothetical protein